MPYGDHVQSTSVDSGSGTTANLAFTSNNTLGNTLVAAARYGAVSGVTPGISDSRGNVWVLCDENPVAGGGETLVLWVCVSCAAGANTVTITNASSITRRWGISEYSGASTRDQHAQADGASTALNSGNMTTTTATELIVAVGCVGGDDTFVAGASYTIRWTVTTKMAFEDRLVTSTGTYAASFSVSTIWNWGCNAQTLASAGAGPPGTPQENTFVRTLAVSRAALF